MLTRFSLYVPLIVGLLLAGKTTASEFPGYTCDELTPDLCDLIVEEGLVPIQENGLLVKYWKYSSSSVSSHPSGGFSKGAPAPLIMIHGGPGMTHKYMLPLKQLACRADKHGRTRDVYFYDQGGSGESVIPVHSSTNSSSSSDKDKDTDMEKLVDDHPYLLDPQYYATIELPRIIEHLGFDNDGRGYHIVGNSWGTILAQYFVSNTDAKGLKSIILSGPLSDGDLYIKSQWSETGTNNLGQLPPFIKHRIKMLEDEEAYGSDEYQAINHALTGRFTCRTQPAPKCFMAIWDGINPYVYVGLQGPSEFSFGGVLEGFNTTPGLHTIGVPVALLSGEYDTMRPPVVDVMYREIPLAEWTIFPHSGHLTMIDDAGLTNDVVDNFLRRVEAAASKGRPFSPRLDMCGPSGCVQKYNTGVDVYAGTDSGYSFGTVVLVGIISFFVGGKIMNASDRSDGYNRIT